MARGHPGGPLKGAVRWPRMRTQATFRWTSEDPDPTLTLTGLIAEGLAEAGFGCTQIEDLDYAHAFRTIVGQCNFFLMVGEMADGVRQWLVSTKSELGVFAYLMGSRDYQEYEVLTGVLHDGVRADAETDRPALVQARGLQRTPGTPIGRQRQASSRDGPSEAPGGERHMTCCRSGLRPRERARRRRRRRCGEGGSNTTGPFHPPPTPSRSRSRSREGENGRPP